MTPAKTATLDASLEESQVVSPMQILVDKAPEPPKPGDIVEGPVLALDRARLYIDLPPFGTGVIYGREYMNAREVIKRTNIGDIVAAKVIATDTKDGYIELSLKEARQAIVWAEAEEALKNKTPFELLVKEANKGGLILEWQGLGGFLPASQLKAEHYPRVTDGDKDKILDELRKLVGTKLPVTIISATPKEGKLIFSEKGADDKEKKELIATYQVGDVVQGEVTGMVDFGAFIKLEEGLEGLVHISEIDWGLVDDPRHFFKVGDKVKVKIIDIKDGKVSLSVKQLKENPWQVAATKYNKGDKVEGVVIKFNKHGALASIEEGIAGLVHISEFGSEEKLRQTLELGHRYPFTISVFDPKEMRMALTFTGDKK
ncbi:MAG TPA: S1 RNA-binding domain-containing protein [Candidatus Paceibacterota bacterium]|nr:S1 RNA-binding domain-containing protein [Candidatus Paceibacterota bacterium]